ncbi:HlyD family type I secretion periplasmic adaptor subunit [Azospirillum sp. B510]|uniref:HlyD family type I secretion periplasmic adaptor subunit n=1 Tax=Azospirillum sp. (strain B510) TaxID=137722 RepID=UPI0013051DA9|nr:HlyD family type I secretion periplasmic adaptor subunit [Azospirillum sp. B510]
MTALPQPATTVSPLPSRPLPSRPLPSRRRIALEIAAVLLALGAWAAVGPLDVATTASGEVVPASRVKAIQHLEGGIVTEILASEGDRVSRGQPLFRLDPTKAQAEAVELARRLASLRIDLARLTAEIAKAPAPSIDPEAEATAPEVAAAARDLFLSHRDRLAHEARSQAQLVAQKEAELEESRVRLRNNRRALEIVNTQVTISENLLSKELSNRMTHLEQLRQQQALRTLVDGDQAAQPRLEAALGEARERLAWVEGSAAEQARHDLATVRQQYDELSQRMQTLRNVEERTVLRTPVDGIVKTVNVTTEGGVVQPGQVLAEVVPGEDRLVVDARLPVQDIGYVHAGLPVRVVLSSGDASSFPPIDGRVERVSPDATMTSDGHAFYRVRVATEQSAFEATGRRYQLYPGMQVTCSILIGRRTVLEYLLSPWITTLRFAFQER